MSSNMTREQEFLAYSEGINSVKGRFEDPSDTLTKVITVKLEDYNIQFYFDGLQRTFGCMIDKKGNFYQYIERVPFN